MNTNISATPPLVEIDSFDLTTGRVFLHSAAFALRPVRIREDDLVFYSATTFPEEPREGCRYYLQLLLSLGHLGCEDGTLLVDVLDRDGNVLQYFTVSQTGFEYLRKTFDFHVM